MPAIVENEKEERFCQARLMGKGIARAYVCAGYKPNPGAATRLSRKPRVVARLEELSLQRRTALASIPSIDKGRITEMLLEDRMFARSVGAAGAAVSATEKLAKLHGLVVDRKESGAPGAFKDVSDAELDAMLAEQKRIADERNTNDSSLVATDEIKPEGEMLQ